ncbi:hypothetical protein PR202_ga14884 [Eleusine coracana subsp. coracana]|uniref:Protein kinase domain-containing protein n=1 Tax=Eleusine coracana subsp. coracana TaxID=191504 RepID=A0AAV5CIQ3_ELECO|nr:hypothetical protein PR202_ga14884 [Eleusine coracana subsp. coracana]
MRFELSPAIRQASPRCLALAASCLPPDLCRRSTAVCASVCGYGDGAKTMLYSAAAAAASDLRCSRAALVLGYFSNLHHGPKNPVRHGGRHRGLRTWRTPSTRGQLMSIHFTPYGASNLFCESPGLDWHKRYKIIMGICCGLHYLHEQWDTRGTWHQNTLAKTSEATLKRKCSEVDLQCTEMRLAKRPATTLEFTDRLNEPMTVQGMRYRVGRTVDHSTGMEEPRRGQSQVSSGLPQAPLDSTRGPSLVCGADPKGLRDLGRLFVLFSGLLQMRFITQRHDEQEALGLLFWHLGAMLLILSLAAEQYPKQAAAGVAVVRALRNHLFRVF